MFEQLKKGVFGYKLTHLQHYQVDHGKISAQNWHGAKKNSFVFDDRDEASLQPVLTFHVEVLLVRCKGGYVCVYGAAQKFIRKLQITQNFPNCENLPKIKVERAFCKHHSTS